jgi:hypothetical protein
MEILQKNPSVTASLQCIVRPAWERVFHSPVAVRSSPDLVDAMEELAARQSNGSRKQTPAAEIEAFDR